MHMQNTALLTLIAAIAAPAARAEFAPFVSTVAITYTCPTQTGSLPTCTTSYAIPRGRLLVVQDVNGSATPINPNAAGNFSSDQASLLVTTEVTDQPAATNTIGPHYAIANSAAWNFHELTDFYTNATPVVKNNGGSVVLQGYLLGY